MRITIDLSEKDLDHFRQAMTRAKEAAKHLAPDQIAAAARQLLADSAGVELPEFISARLAKLDTMINMGTDQSWGITDDERREILSALTYFADPDDAIPDDVPVLGFLDDAIMIELVVEELKHELDAYEDFLAFRARAEQESGAEFAGGLSRQDWLEQRQEELLERMRRKRGRDGGSYGSGRGFSLFSVR
jgi:uncharacterized membrane protein YkvA (DUF1232 family)